MEVLSVNVGSVAAVQLGSHPVLTGIFKQPVPDSPVWVGREGLAGDAICDPRHHGGPDQAVYVYGERDYEWWAGERGRGIPPGTFGENLTISDFESAACRIGDRMQINSVVLEVTAPRIPCGKFSARMDDPQFVKRFWSAGRPGVYCRVITEGEVEAGSAVRLQPFAGPTISIMELWHDYYDPDPSPDAIRRILAAPIAARVRSQKEFQLRELLEKQAGPRS